MKRVTATGREWKGTRLVMALIALFIGGYVSVRIALHVASLIDPGRLVPVSGADILSAIPLILVLHLLGMALVRSFPIREAVAWYSVFFFVRIFVAVLLSQTFQFDDERAFHYAGLEQVYGIISFEAGRAYYHLVNALYGVFGANILLPKMVNAFVGSLLPFFAFDIARWLFGDRKAGWRAFLFTGLLPPFIIFSAVNLKEIATGFLLVLLAWILANPKTGYTRRLVGSGICIFVLYWLRGAPLAMVGTLGVFSYYIVSMRLRFSSFLKGALVVGLGALLSVYLLGQIQQTVWSRVTQEEYFIKRFSESQPTVTRFLDVEDPLVRRNLAVLFLRGLFSPSPLRFLMDYGIDTQLEALNMLTWYVLCPLAVIGVLAYRRSRAVVACATIVVGVLIMALVGVMVGSDPYRHRMIAMGLVGILACGGLRRDVASRFRWVTWLWILGVVGFTGLWFTARFG